MSYFSFCLPGCLVSLPSEKGPSQRLILYILKAFWPSSFKLVFLYKTHILA